MEIKEEREWESTQVFMGPATRSVRITDGCSVSSESLALGRCWEI